MTSVRPGKYDPAKPDIMLFDFKSRNSYGLKLDGQGALNIGTISQDDSVHIRAAGKRVGDFDEQRSWKAGRGMENLSEAPEGYWDSGNAWTLSEGRIHPTLLWRFARGIRSCDFDMPKKNRSVTWKRLVGATKWLDISWSSMGLTADYARLWIRRRGTPGILTFRLTDDSAGNPGSTLKSVTVTVGDVTDVVSVLKLFDWSTTQALTASTTYHIVVFGDTNDNFNNCWEVGGYQGGSVGKQSSTGSSWSAASFDMFYYVADADIDRTFYFFGFDNALYVVDSSDAKNSDIWINGDRGKATSGGATTLTDTGKTWVASRWSNDNAWVKITNGTGKGQTRQITANTATQLTVAAWDTNPDSTSEYIIYATEWWTQTSADGLGKVESTPCVVNKIAYFPQGTAANIRRMIWTGSAHAFSDDGTNKAHYLEKFHSKDDVFILRALNNSSYGASRSVSVATAAAYANPPADLVFGTAKSVGDGTQSFTGLLQKDENVYVFKEDGIFVVNRNLDITALQSSMKKTPFKFNGTGNIVHQQFVYYSWLHSLVRIYGANHDDIGQDWSGYGLPDGREGVFTSLESYTSLLMAAVDAGKTGTSSVLGFDGVGWHELFRAYDSAKRIRQIRVQVNEDTRNRTWIECGGDLVYQEMPFMKGSPRLDSGIAYQHEALVESAAIDMGTASGLPKFIKELTVFSEGLGNGNEIFVDYQVDDDVHTTNWTEATVLTESPESSAWLGLENVRKFAYRLRICLADNTSLLQVLGVVPNGYARPPYKMVWTLRCRADNISSKGKLASPDKLMRWLLDNARFPGRIMMTSQYELAHKFYVIVHPPRMFPYKPASAGQAEESVLTVVLEEA